MYYMYYNYHNMNKISYWPNLSIRLSPEALRMAKVAAAASNSTIGKWLADAIEEKIQRQCKTDWQTKWLGL